jgi:hypothetical protein
VIIKETYLLDVECEDGGHPHRQRRWFALGGWPSQPLYSLILTFLRSGLLFEEGSAGIHNECFHQHKFPRLHVAGSE